jgi:pSer/pThr/pTyr-binding forkhead associated (FHA) protein
MPTIRVKTGQNAGLVFDIGEAALVIGRDDRAEIQVLDQGVSRRHAEIFRMGEMYFIRDLESRNGTFVNEERVKEELLRDGDEVRIGSTTLVFEDAGAPVLGHPKPRGRVRVSPSADATTTIAIDEHLARDVDDLAEPTRHEESRDLKVLYRLSRAIADAKDTDALLSRVAEITGEAVRADHACIFLRKEGSKEFELEASWQPEPFEGRGIPVISTRAIKEVLQSSRAVLSGDKMPSPGGDATAPIAPFGRPQAVMCAPLVALDQVLGVLYCAAQEESERFTRETLELVTAIGVQAGMALQALLAVQRQERILVSAVRTLASAVELGHPVYAGHSARVAGYAAGIAQALKIPPSESRRIQLAALLHNLGQIVLPRGTAAQEADRETLRKRAEATVALVSKIEGLEFVLPVIHHYTERMDGSGFPDGLPGDRIPLAARILAVADRLDTLMVRGDPPGYEKLSLKDALVKLMGEAPQRLDSRVVDALMIAYRGGYLLAPEARIA